jgi:hypothetical protein
VAAVAAFALIRGRDFVAQTAPPSRPETPAEPGAAGAQAYAEDR